MIEDVGTSLNITNGNFPIASAKTYEKKFYEKTGYRILVGNTINKDNLLDPNIPALPSKRWGIFCLFAVAYSIQLSSEFS